jgi:hypothetical protein
MTVTVQTSPDNATWNNVASLAAITGVSQLQQAFSGLDRFVRLSYAISGTTPSFTFTTSGEFV